MRRKIFFLIIWSLIFSIQLTAQIPDSTSVYFKIINQYRSIINSEMQKNNVVGLSVAFVDNDSLIWSEGFGFSDKANQIKATPNTQYLIGSVTKTFTGLSVMQLQQKGIVNIDSSLHKYLPAFNINSTYGSINNITVRMLMTHHSGLPGDMVVNWFGDTVESISQTIKYLNADYAAYKPGLYGAYSNAGICMLGNMVQSVSATSYTNYVKGNILEPLQMNHTVFFTPKTKPENLSLAYDRRGIQQVELPIRDMPAASLYSSVTDMAHYIKAITNNGVYNGHELIDKTQLNSMFQVQNANVPLDFGYEQGLVWFIAHNGAGKIVYHHGATLYHRARLAIAVDSKMGFVIEANTNSASAMFYIVNNFLNDAARIKGFISKASAVVASNTKHSLTSVNCKKYTKAQLSYNKVVEKQGVYATRGNYFEIKKKGKKLKAYFEDKTEYLVPVENDEFIPMTRKYIFFKRYDETRRYYFDTIQGHYLCFENTTTSKPEMIGEKQQLIPLSKQWFKREGNYIITNEKPGAKSMLTGFSIKIKSGLIIINAIVDLDSDKDKLEIPLNALSDTMAETCGIGRYCGSKLTVKTNTDGSETLLYLGAELKRINNE